MYHAVATEQPGGRASNTDDVTVPDVVTTFKLRPVVNESGGSLRRIALVGQAGNTAIARTIDWGDGTTTAVPANRFGAGEAWMHPYPSGDPLPSNYTVRVYPTVRPAQAVQKTHTIPTMRFYGRNDTSASDTTPAAWKAVVMMNGSPGAGHQANLSWGYPLSGAGAAQELVPDTGYVHDYQAAGAATGVQYSANVVISPDCIGFEANDQCEVWGADVTLPFPARPVVATSVSGGVVTVTGNDANSAGTHTVAFGDGVILEDVPFRAANSYTHRYNVPGTYTVRAWPTNNDLVWGYSNAVVAVAG
ncbi:hypothetical protein ACIRPQ_28810 [Streptomyces sp. NPDC101213]|uniref:hypothetical protein n=1 Tax=Streptomyces sp. NPDC101213 TaxID=3366130 RepID=UPI00381D15AA